ncbi:hypothetical protein BC827DRAFT_1154220 [Russula dissimulans]|nr:hypothetical protein BC827DRAFT_1154220 [Russula dissimulans]
MVMWACLAPSGGQEQSSRSGPISTASDNDIVRSLPTMSWVSEPVAEIPCREVWDRLERLIRHCSAACSSYFRGQLQTESEKQDTANPMPESKMTGDERYSGRGRSVDVSPAASSNKTECLRLEGSVVEDRSTMVIGATPPPQPSWWKLVRALPHLRRRNPPHSMSVATPHWRGSGISFST